MSGWSGSVGGAPGNSLWRADGSGPSGPGGEPVTGAVRLWLPPRGRATVTARFDVAPTPPWPGTDYRPRFDLAPYDGEPADEALRPDDGSVAPRSVLAAPIAVFGRSGVHIRLHTLPVSADGGGSGGTPTFAPGTPVTVFGVTHPPVPRLVLTDRNERRVHEIATVPVDVDGRFALYRWRADGGGYHEVGALYRSHRPDFADDYACVRSFLIADGGPPQPDAEAPAVAVRSRVLSVTRSGRTTVALSCPAEHWRRCEGALAIRLNGVRTQAPYSVPAGTRGRVDVRLRPLRRALQRPAARAVVNVLPADGGTPTQRRLPLRPRR